MLFGKENTKPKQPENVDMEPEEEVSFEEVLLMRLVFELNDAIKGTRSPEFTDFLDSIIPAFDEYRKIILAVINLKEHDLPKNAATAESNISPYPQGQVGFTRRAILGELVKFSMHLNHRDEMVRNQIVSLFFQLISDIDHSFNDYEHLMRTRKFMIT